ncbi:unnamed protein product [Symbiodinium sp. KB8]|nr:unnamed protein product [Symbiodinium sp. KB8]
MPGAIRADLWIPMPRRTRSLHPSLPTATFARRCGATCGTTVRRMRNEGFRVYKV